MRAPPRVRFTNLAFRLTACFASVIALSSAVFGQSSLRPPANEVSLVSLSPGEVPLAALDKEIPITAIVGYVVDIADTVAIQLEMNLSHPTRFTRVAETEVKRGRGTVTLHTWVTAGKRDESQPLMVRARFAAPLRDDQGNELISAPRSILIGQRPTDSVDGIMILGCEPERLVPDREQEVAVLVSYDLKTAAKGEINVGFNSSSPNSFTVLARRVVEKGSGQIVITAKVKPRAWGEKVFFQAYVNISEYPHGSHWTPLASDLEPLELAAP